MLYDVVIDSLDLCLAVVMYCDKIELHVVHDKTILYI